MNIIKKHINMNYSKGVKIDPYYIVIHETDNTSRGANAEAHYQYWNTNKNANSSVHYVVDDKQVIQLLENYERAWHVGDNKNHSNITNSNSIGIEICVNSDGDYNKAYANTIELVRHLLKTTSMNHIARHYDASGKHCPRNIMDKNLWQDFIDKCIAKDTINTEDVINQLYGITCSLNAYASTVKNNEIVLSNIKAIQGVMDYLKSVETK